MEHEFSFDKLPTMIGALLSSMERIESILGEQASQVATIESDRWFDINELCDYLPDHPSIQTVYGWTNNRQIPFHKPRKKLQFLKSEIDTWIKSSKRKSISEIAAEADKYSKSRKRRSR